MAKFIWYARNMGEVSPASNYPGQSKIASQIQEFWEVLYGGMFLPLRAANLPANSSPSAPGKSSSPVDGTAISPLAQRLASEPQASLPHSISASTQLPDVKTLSVNIPPKDAEFVGQNASTRVYQYNEQELRGGFRQLEQQVPSMKSYYQRQEKIAEKAITEGAQGVIQQSDSDNQAIANWFGRPALKDFKVYVAPAGITGVNGAAHYGPPGDPDRIVADTSLAKNGKTLTSGFVSAEMVESYEDKFLPNWDAGKTNGEALSRVLSNELHPEMSSDPSTAIFTSGESWWNNGKPEDYINGNPDYKKVAFLENSSKNSSSASQNPMAVLGEIYGSGAKPDVIMKPDAVKWDANQGGWSYLQNGNWHSLPRSVGFQDLNFADLKEWNITRGNKEITFTPDPAYKNQASDRDEEANAAGVLFLQYLHDKLGFGWSQIIHAGGNTLGETYANLIATRGVQTTGKQGFNEFLQSLPKDSGHHLLLIPSNGNPFLKENRP